MGAQLNLWSLSPDTGNFNIVGKSECHADGQSIITIEGGVTASAWHFPLASSPVPAPNQGNGFCRSCRTAVGSEANLGRGKSLCNSQPAFLSISGTKPKTLAHLSSVSADPRPILALDSILSARDLTLSYSTRLLIGGVQQGGEFSPIRAPFLRLPLLPPVCRSVRCYRTGIGRYTLPGNGFQ